ncbi:WhiB family transcriptional regulator [Streptomyces sp. NPDC058295]|uniref:WhiB family transcriptional regulator n=1 Tax=Streptomyces sp. NPDC058295 TaxID=3346431 RepID=UPI0036E73DA6
MTTMTPPTSRATNQAAQARDWRSYATCRETDPELFFAIGPRSARETAQAKRVCGGCPVRTACLEWALDTGQSHGVWGGLDEAERRQVARNPFSHRAVALANQEFIEEQVAAKVSLRQIAAELGIGHAAVRHAVAEFRANRASSGDVEEVQAA